MSELALTSIAHDATTEPIPVEPRALRQALMADIVFGLEGYEALEADWERLAGLQPVTVVFQTRSLLKAWARHFVANSSRDLATVVVRDANRIVLIWPLVVKQHGLARVASGAGVPISQYDDILFDPNYEADAAFEAAMDIVVHTIRPDLISLERVRADSALRAALNGSTPLPWAEGAPYADLSDGMEGIWSSRKPRVLRQRKKRVRTLNKAGAVTFGVARDGAEATAWINEALALKREWLLGTGRVSRAFMNRRTAACLTDLAQTITGAGDDARMVVSRLTLDERTAAIEVGLCHREAYHLYLGAFQPDFAKLGPGNVLTENVLEWCVENGLSRYDMLAPRSRNKREWQTGEVAIMDFALPLTSIGWLFAEVMLKRVSPAMRDTFYALPQGVRTFIASKALRL